MTHAWKSFIVLSLLVLFTETAFAQFNRTAVSITGNDANNCAVATPCRSFDRALMQTIAGGEVIALDSGGYGSFTVNKAATVMAAPGIYAGITPSAQPAGIRVTAGAGDTVVLQGLTVRGGVPGIYGIFFESGGSLHVERCNVGKLSGHGIFAQTVSNSRLFVHDTLIIGVDIGILFSAQSGATLSGSVSNTRVQGLSNAAFYASDRSKVTISKSLASGSAAGYRLLNFEGTTVEMTVDDSVASNNSTGVLMDSDGGTSVLRASNMTISHNGTGISIAAGGTKSALSYGNNRLAGNSVSGAFTGTVSEQ